MKPHNDPVVTNHKKTQVGKSRLPVSPKNSTDFWKSSQLHELSLRIQSPSENGNGTQILRSGGDRNTPIIL